MSGIKHPSEYNQQEVSIFLMSIGLGNKTEIFKENGCDGEMIVSLTDEDLTMDLGMSKLQARKFQKSLSFAIDIAAESGSGSGGGIDEDTQQKLRDLEEVNGSLKDDIEHLNGIIKSLQGQLGITETDDATRALTDVDEPSIHPEKPKKTKRPVIRNAAVGAAGGAALGATIGAITGDPKKGAKIGAAVGGGTGVVKGLGERRRARRAGRK